MAAQGKRRTLATHGHLCVSIVTVDYVRGLRGRVFDLPARYLAAAAVARRRSYIPGRDVTLQELQRAWDARFATAGRILGRPAADS